MWLDDEVALFPWHVKQCENCRDLAEYMKANPMNALGVRNLRAIAKSAAEVLGNAPEIRWYSDHVPGTPEEFNSQPIAIRVAVLKLSRIIYEMIGGERLDPPANGKSGCSVMQRQASA